MRKIFIAGCRKSGTNLLLRMFWGFKGTVVLPKEVPLRKLAVVKRPRSGIIVSKQCDGQLMGFHVTRAMAEEQMDIAIEHKVDIVTIIRDGRDVVCSEGGRVPPMQWISAINQTMYFKPMVKAIVKFEDLIRTPDKVQKRLAEALDLEVKNRFSAYPKFVPSSMESAWRNPSGHIKPGYSNRPLDPKRIGVGKKNYQRYCTNMDIRCMETALRAVGYLTERKR